MRTKAQIHLLSGHTGTVADIKFQDYPQVITSSLDLTVRLWDFAAGKTMVMRTRHKKSKGRGCFFFNFGGHNAIINTLSVNSEGAIGDNGSITFWDDATGHRSRRWKVYYSQVHSRTQGYSVHFST
ncbi:hypothetical protein BC826DRAFT_1149353 [Russula brevipes]|nr:hypothetical protein BC826DRAFT_1149353 [Russula brevipes]